MALKNRFIFWCVVLLLGVAVVGAVSLWDLIAVRRATSAMQAEYEAADHAEAALVQVAWLHDVLLTADAATYVDIKSFQPFQNEIDALLERLGAANHHDDPDGSAESVAASSISMHLDAAMQRCKDAEGASAAAKAAVAKTVSLDLDVVQRSLIDVSKRAPNAARRHVTLLSVEISDRLWWMSLVLAIVLMVSVAIHYRQYRALVQPLLWLRENMRKSAANQYRVPVRAIGGNEFSDVATAFNGLARDLADLYRGMEEKIIARSRELVQSERLASVGFLAAGVAHEINNPLSIISGYAELAGKALRRLVLGGDSSSTSVDADAEAQSLVTVLEAQDLIRDEAFRCKEITTRLLSLARGSADGRQPLSMEEVARQVTVLTKGLRNYRDRRLILDFKASESLDVIANPSEMKQVLLNLTINALEAVPAERGEVRIGGRRAGEWIELSIEDNGKGMSPETLQHVFEPFFTAKRGAGEPGTGLGLSITHAIVENHGGRIRAESSGPGRGSRFTVRLPAKGGATATIVTAESM